MTRTRKDPVARAACAARRLAVTVEAWTAWKEEASAALRQHAEAVEHCQVCAIPVAKVAGNFMNAASCDPGKPHITKRDKRRYHEIKGRRPDRGEAAVEFAAAFRAEHGHGPSVAQLCSGLGWGEEPRLVRAYIVNRLLANGWLTSTPPVPWTLRPDLRNPLVADQLSLATATALPAARTRASQAV